MKSRIGCLMLVSALVTVSPAWGLPPADRPVLDTLGDPLPPGAVARFGTARLWHPGGATDAAITFSPDGKTLATAGRGGVIFWDVATGKEKTCLKGGNLYYFNSLDFSRDGRTLFGGSRAEHASMCFWDVPTGTILRDEGGPNEGARIPSFPYTHQVRPYAVLSAGTVVVRRKGGRIQTLDATTGKPVQTPGNISAVDGGSVFLAFSRDGAICACDGKENEVYLWDVACGRRLARLAGHKNGSLCGAFSPDGRYLVTGGYDGLVKQWRVPDGKPIRTWQHDEYPILSVQYVTGRAQFVSTGGNCVCLWDAASGRLLRSFGARGMPIYGSAVSPDGKLLALVSFPGTVTVYVLETGAPLHRFAGHRFGVESLFLPAGGNQLISSGTDGVVVWDLRNATVVKRLPPSWPAAFSRDGAQFVSRSWEGFLRRSCQNPPQLWDARAGKVVRTFPQVEGAHVAAISPNGKYLVLSECSKDLWEPPHDPNQLYELTTGKWLGTFGADSVGKADATTAFSVFSYDSTLVAIGGMKRPVEIWSVPDLKLVRTLDFPGGSTAAFSPDGTRLVVTVDYSGVYLFDITTGKELRTICEFGPYAAGPVAFTPDGRILATATEGNCSVQLWETATWKVRRRLDGHERDVANLAISPDGRYLASSARLGNVILLWSLTESLPDGPHPSLADLWTALAGDDAEKAYQAIGHLAATPDETLPLLERELTPVPSNTASRIAKSVARLGSDRFADRTIAMQELQRAGEQAEAALRAALQNNPNLELRRRAELLLNQVMADRENPPGPRLRQLRALEVLERLGTPAARALLRRLASGAAADRLTREARAALRRLNG